VTVPVLHKPDLTKLLGGERKKLILVLTSIGILLTYHLIFFRYFPNRQGFAGHDFSLFLPRLLDGYIWAKTNSLFSIPWFTPSFCGGEPAYPDPQNVYFTLPQLLTVFVNPLQSVYFTIVLMTIAGFIGCYQMLRSVFNSSATAALLGATLFLFNGFFIYRLVEGAIVFHAFMLFPWIIYFAFKEQREGARPAFVRNYFLSGIMVALLAAYWIFSGMVNILIPLGLSALIILLAQFYNRRLDPVFWKLALVSVILFFLIVAGKLNAELSYMQHFDRSFYRLPGTASIFDGIYITFRSLFFPSTRSDLQYFLVNQEWYLARHEFEYGVTFVPLVVFGLYLFKARVTLNEKISQMFKPGHRAFIPIAIFIIMVIPVALNYYQPDWNRLLKSIPVLENSSTLIRFNVMYILPIVILSSVLLDKVVRSGTGKFLLTAILIIMVIGINALTDRSFYNKESYDPTAIDAAYSHIKSTGHVPRINYVANIEETNLFSNPTQVNADFSFGISRLKCYEPMFGYRLEAFPIKTLHPGPVNDVTNGWLNLKNPACYVYPKTNACEPGDHFSVNEQMQAERFASYRPYPFKLPMRQVVLNYVSLFSVLGCMLILIAAMIERVIPRLGTRKGRIS
jgi:hypothetical protein